MEHFYRKTKYRVRRKNKRHSKKKDTTVQYKLLTYKGNKNGVNSKHIQDNKNSMLTIIDSFERERFLKTFIFILEVHFKLFISFFLMFYNFVV